MTDATPPRGPRVSLRVAADLIGLPRTELDALVGRGIIRTERIRGKLFIDLDDAERTANELKGGGAPS